jgi:two-component system, LytTR family, sensor kinase
VNPATPGEAVALAHLLGFSTSMALYAMLAVMTLRNREIVHGRRSTTLGNGALALATAILGLIWNTGALLSFAARDLGVGASPALVDAIAYSALGILPAVVIHSAARDMSVALARSAVFIGYLLGGLAALGHAGAALTGGIIPGSVALQALTVGYIGVVAVLALAVRGRFGARPLTAAALAVFAAGALHLGSHTNHAEPLLEAVIGHHASLLLALVVLYQDYRFALVDIFLKRMLTILALVALAWALHATIAEPFVIPRLAGVGTNVLAVAALLGLWVVTAMSYPVLRSWVEWVVDRGILRRPDHDLLQATIASRIAVLNSPEDVLSSACNTLRSALSSRSVTWTVEDGEDDGAGTAIAIPTAEEPRFLLHIGELEAGRRLLSADLQMLRQVAVDTARRIDAVRVTAERHERDLREESISRLASEAELRALRSQLEPHFLFNALNTLAELMQSAPDRALDTLYRLTGLLRIVLTRSSHEFITLGQELELVESYLAIEGARFEERLQVTIDAPAGCRVVTLPPLLIQPLVENAVKHGIAPRLAGGTVHIRARLEFPRDSPAGQLRVSVEDSGEAMVRSRADGAGVGLASIRGRLQNHYGAAASLGFSTSEFGTVAELLMPAGSPGGKTE